MATPPISRLIHEVYRAFPTAYTMGTYNRRKIAGSSAWSQHSWSNAEDIGVGTLALGDEVLAWLQANATRLGLRRFGIRRRPALWKVKNHYDHLHVEGLPTMTGIPPLAGGTLPATEEDDMKQGDSNDDVKRYQDALNDVGYGPIAVDGDYGPATAAATLAAQTDIGFAANGAVASAAFMASLFARQHPGIHMQGAPGPKGAPGPPGSPGPPGPPGPSPTSATFTY